MGKLQKYNDAAVVEEALDKGKAAHEALGGHTIGADVPENAVFTDTIYDDSEVKEDIDRNKTDISLVDKRVTQLEKATDKTDYTRYGLPMLYLTGSTDGMTKENPVTLNYKCTDKDGIVKEGTCTLKWQGSSSLAYEKKNYTIKFDSELEVVDGWGAQKKYCLKANFIDHSHARNLVCAKLWGQIVKSRAKKNTKLNDLPNAGAVDGFPVIIMLNDEFHGLYTWNIPKDAWMFGMGSGTHEAIVCADVPLNEGAVAFKVLADFKNDFELEYSSYDEAEVLSSLNRLIQAVIDSNGADLDTTIAKYLDWDSAIDYYIFSVLITGLDNTKKNYILATYDGEKWFYSAYDMDSTFGIDWDGGSFLPADRRPTFSTRTSDNLMKLIWNYKRQRLHDRCQEIMESVFSESNIAIEFSNFIGKLPSPILKKDVELYPSIPCSAVNNTSQIFNYYRLRFACALKWLEEMLDGYAGDVESSTTATNVVPLSVDESGNIYNGTGYKDGYRLNSSGTEKEQANSTLTGFIRCNKGDIIRMTGAVFAEYASGGSEDGLTPGNGVGALYSYLALYDANKTKIAISQATQAGMEGLNVKITWGTFPVSVPSDIVTFDLTNIDENTAYIRINAVGQGANMIVTINEEI